MSIVTHAVFIEQRIKSEANTINELYIRLNSYIQLVREMLAEIPDPAAYATLERLVDVIDRSKNQQFSIDERMKFFNAIKAGIVLLDYIIEAYIMRGDTCQITTLSTSSSDISSLRRS